MRLLLLLVVATCISLTSLRAQYNPPSEVMRELLASSTLEVVLTGDEEFDSALRKVIGEEYTFGKYSFMTDSEFNSAHEDKDEVCALAMGVGDFKIPISGSSYLDLKNGDFFGLINKYREEEGKYNKFHLSGYLIDFPGDTGLDIETALRWFVRAFNNDSFGKDSKDKMKDMQKEVKNKTLLLPDYTYESSLAEIQAVYPHPVELASPERIKQALMDKEDVIIDMVGTLIIEGPMGNQGVDYHSYISANTCELVHFKTKPFYAKEDPEKLKAIKVKTEASVLKAFAKLVK